MPLQNKCSLNLKKEHSIWNTLYQIRSCLNIDHKQFAEALSLSFNQYQKIGSLKQMPSAHSIINLADFLDLSYEKIMTGSIDFKALSRRYSGDSKAIPEKYMKAPRSKKRTSINVLDYLEQTYGWQTRQNALRHFQLSEEAIENPEEWINVLFLMDLCNYLAQLGFSDKELFHMGGFSVMSNFDSELGQKYQRLESVKEIIQTCFEEFAPIYYDKNVDYKIVKMTKNQAIIKAISNKEAKESLDLKEIGNTNYCKTKTGAFASFPAYIGLPYAHTSEVSCIHRGDSSCQYLIDFEYSNFIQKSSLASFSH